MKLPGSIFDLNGEGVLVGANTANGFAGVRDSLHQEKAFGDGGSRIHECLSYVGTAAYANISKFRAIASAGAVYDVAVATAGLRIGTSAAGSIAWHRLGRDLAERAHIS